MDMISPGVYTQIIDMSEYLTSTPGTIGFLPIITEKGPDNVLTRITSYQDYIDKFGEPDIRVFGKYYGCGAYVATQHLSVCSDLYVLRALPDDATYAHAYIYFSEVKDYTSSTYKFDKTYQDIVGKTDSEIEAEYDGTHAGLSAFSVQAGISYPLTSDIVCDGRQGYTLDPDKKVEAILAGVAYDEDGVLVTVDPESESGDESESTTTTAANTDIDPETLARAVVTTDPDFAKKGKAPKMNNTQIIDSMFSGNDVLISQFTDGKVYTEGGIKPHQAVLASVRAVGRGDAYNTLSIRIASDANPAKFGTYKFQVYELQDGAEVMCESYNISFDPTAVDGDGESMYFVDVINKFSTRVVVEANEEALSIMQEQMEKFYKNDPTIKDITSEYGPSYTAVPYFDEDAGVVANDEPPVGMELGYKARIMWGAYHNKAWAAKYTADAAKAYADAVAMSDTDAEKASAIETAIDMMTKAQQMQQDAETTFNWASAQNLMNMADSDSITSGDQTYYLENGSIGSLVNSKGLVNPLIGNQILAQAYTGLLKNPVIVKKVDESTGTVTYTQKYTNDVYDLDWIYFSIVYDPGYKPDVKDAARELVETYRRDCVLISDCGDNADCDSCLKYVGAVQGAADARIWNTYLAARYEPYSRVYDKFTGKDIWVSPVYHMAKLIPQTDALYDLWYAPAGFTRGTASEVKELRWSANKAQRDLLYQAQVNPIVHFPEGMTVWGQLTTQKKASTLSDLNCVRCVLYIKRALEQFCQNFIFDMNDVITHQKIKDGIAPFLDRIVAARGLKSYTLDVGATDYEFKTKTCHVNVMLEPMKVIEKIQLNLYIK